MKVGDKVSLNGIVVEVLKNEALGSRYRIKIKTLSRITELYMEEDEFSGSHEVDGAITVPAKVEKIVDEEMSDTIVTVRVKCNDSLSHLQLWEREINGVSPSPTPGPEPELDKVVVSPESGDVDMFGTLVSEMQDNLAIADHNITGTLKRLTSGALVDRWGEGYFMGLKFTTDDWDAFESVKVGMSPSYGDGLVDIRSDPDHDGAWKVTDKNEQKFVVEADDARYEYNLSNLVLS